jgi:hypothetical protein
LRRDNDHDNRDSHDNNGIIDHHNGQWFRYDHSGK